MLDGNVSDARIAKAKAWAQERLKDCERTRRESRSDQSRDHAYGESVAIRAMLHILDGGEVDFGGV